MTSGLINHLSKDLRRQYVSPLGDRWWDEMTEAGLGRFDNDTITRSRS